MWINTLYRLGANVKRSLRWFLFGLAQGVLAGGLIYHGYHHHHYFQIAGLILLVPAVGCLVYGYVGILANRLSHMVEDIRNKRKHNQKLMALEDEVALSDKNWTNDKSKDNREVK